MDDAGYGVAIETSSRQGSVTLGRGDAILETVRLPEQRRHAVELMPAIDRLCRSRGVGARDIRRVYVSIGPGSFTGLRIGVTTAKVLGWVTGAELVGVPTLEVVAANAWPEEPAGEPGPRRDRVAVMLNAKGGRSFTGIFEQGRAVMEPCLMTPAQLCEVYRGQVIGDHLPEHDWPADIELLDPALAVPRSDVVWSIGRRMAGEGRFTPALELSPLYVRLPEAEELWQMRVGSQGSGVRGQ